MKCDRCEMNAEHFMRASLSYKKASGDIYILTYTIAACETCTETCKSRYGRGNYEEITEDEYIVYSTMNS